MKRRVSIVMIAVMIISSMAFAAGCGDDDAGIVGTWTLTGWQYKGTDQSLEEYGADIESTMTFTEEGEVSIIMSENNKSTGTWKLDGEELEVTSSGATQTGKLKDGKIYLGDDDNGYAIYEKE